MGYVGDYYYVAGWACIVPTYSYPQNVGGSGNAEVEEGYVAMDIYTW
jgi:hypothetical protein